MPIVTTLGFPRIGRRRELKKALEAHWNGELDVAGLHAAAADLRHRHRSLMQAAGASVVPVNDFSLYDHVLDHALLFDAVPASHRPLLQADPMAGYFALARGHQGGGFDLRALEMTKWFDTNYHYLVPELAPNQRFRLAGDKPLVELAEARAQGLLARPVLLGPVSFLRLSKRIDGGDPLDLLDALLPTYGELLERLLDAGAEWVQMDEPCLALDHGERLEAAFVAAYAALACGPRPHLLLANYFGPLGPNLDLATRLPVQGLHLDLVRGAGELDAVLSRLPGDRVLSAGIVDGRNVWRDDLGRALAALRPALDRIGRDRLWLAPSCSLLHLPIDANEETGLDPVLHGGLAFARQKIELLGILAGALDGDPAAEAALAASDARRNARLAAPTARDSAVRRRLADIRPEHARRRSPLAQRAATQAQALALPVFPTTTIGSFPQTAELRRLRASHRAGRLSDADYAHALATLTAEAIAEQERLGLDVLVHGEFERNDMVEFFGERLAGFAFTRQGWVQSYGSRCVKPPILHGDVSRPGPMTVDWSAHAQSLTRLPVKGMLTGPVTILQWSFVRDDQPRADTCRQIALALRDEVADLEAAGIRIVQIDEPALREGLPLRRADWAVYLEWAAASFRLAASGADDATQIHSHMCYSEFNDIIEAIAALDADVVSIETSRSRMELLDAFGHYRYPGAVGPGVYDIHSPRVPSVEEMEALLDKALRVLAPGQLWVNPDCGLKTRGWPETRQALAGMVEAARRLRQTHATEA